MITENLPTIFVPKICVKCLKTIHTQFLSFWGKNHATNNIESGVGEMDERAEPEENQQLNERRENGINMSNLHIYFNSFS